MDTLQDLQAIAVQEQTLVLSRCTASDAWQLGMALRDMAEARGHALVIDIRTFSLPLFFCTLGTAVPDNVSWARRKGNVVAHFHRSSYALGLRMQQAGSTLADKHGLPVSEYAAHGGAFPLTLEGAGVIGSVTVSGLPQRADHELVVEGLCAHLGMDYAQLALAKGRDDDDSSLSATGVRHRG
ncbi:heme-degrading domain-containing protein [Paraburkholderia hayleyella]|uniref:heme-degrading domain-containing protein n=1 Tax=Paraburkholderia hayleyella TaxID=2152889 RepID=UPI0012928F0A|nr:heme-degrading domain-containing protein [Paraburkholderia hayleyella]